MHVLSRVPDTVQCNFLLNGVEGFGVYAEGYFGGYADNMPVRFEIINYLKFTAQ